MSQDFMKRCLRCEETKLTDKFPPINSDFMSKSGSSPVCLDCLNEEVDLLDFESVDKYCRLYSMSKESIVELLKEKHIDMINGLQYSLSRQQRRRLEREYKDKPYGANVNIRIFGRLCGGR